MNNFKQTNKKRRIDTTFSNRARIRIVTGKKLRRKSEQQQQQKNAPEDISNREESPTDPRRQTHRAHYYPRKEKKEEKRKPTRKGRIFSHETMGTRHKGERACAA